MIEGLLLIETEAFEDPRGFYKELWVGKNYLEFGIKKEFVADGLSFSHKGVLRGIHFQNPHPQGKLVSVLQGEVFDVAVDLRKSSKTFGQWVGEILSSKNGRQFYLPPGLGHGFCALTEEVLFSYKFTDTYFPREAHTIRWNDPILNIDWPVGMPLVSEKDSKGYFFSEIPQHLLFD